MYRMLINFLKVRLLGKKVYFCEEPWSGIFTVRVDGDVICCPCYANVKIGNIYQSSMHDVWNSEKLLSMRRSFKKGALPDVCKNQVCPVVVGK